MLLNSRYTQTLLSVLLTGCLIAPSWASQPSPSMSSVGEKTGTQSSQTINLPSSLFFMTPGGEPTQVSSGDYLVETREHWIQLTPIHGEHFDSVLLEAQKIQLAEPVESMDVQLRTAPAEHPDLHPLVLLSTTGMAYEAVGSETGVWPRWGWSSIKNTAKKVGGGVKNAAKKVGSGVKRGARTVAGASKRVGRTVWSGAKKVGSGVKRGTIAVGSGIKRGAQAARNQFCPSDPKPQTPFIQTNAQNYREPSSDYLKLAYRWAPVHYQDTASNPKADYITNFDYDGDWRATNNWDNLHRAPLRAYAYYSVSETKTHWFIMYGFFHPRDYAACIGINKSNIIGEHENDMEGTLAIVKKTRSQYGQLEGMVTVSHHDFFSYKTKNSRLRSGGEGIDGTLQMVKHQGSLHPMTAQEAHGHGLKAWPQVGMTLLPSNSHAARFGKKQPTPDFRGGDGVVYYPSTVERQRAEIPEHKNDRYVEYALIDFHGKNGIWQHRTNPLTFTQNTGAFSTKFLGDNSSTCGGGKLDAKMCQTNAANAPWGWDDVGDKVIVQIGKGDNIAKGIIATNPAKLVKHYFANLGGFSMKYIHNPYDEPWEQKTNKRLAVKSGTWGSAKMHQKMKLPHFSSARKSR